MDFLTLINMIPGASSVVNTLQSKMGDFLKTPSRIQTDQAWVSKLLAVAQTKNDTAGISELSAAQNTLPVLMESYNGVLPLVQQISGQAGSVNTDLLTSSAGLAEQVTEIVVGVNKIESVLKRYRSKYSGSLGGGSVFGEMLPSANSALLLGGLGLTLITIWYIARRRR